MPLLQVCPTLNDRTPDNPWPQPEQVPQETYAALPADRDVASEATACHTCHSKAAAPVAQTPQAPALVAQTPRVAVAQTPQTPALVAQTPRAAVAQTPQSPPQKARPPLPPLWKQLPPPREAVPPPPPQTSELPPPPPPPAKRSVKVFLASFGHFQRVPPRGHIVVDLREMERGYGYGRDTSGLNWLVQAQIGASLVYQRILHQVCDCIHDMAMNLNEIRVAIGCKWGKHRSVAMVEDLGILLCDPSPVDFNVRILHLEQFRWDRSRSAPEVELQWEDRTCFRSIFRAGP